MVIALTIAKNTAAMAEMIASIPRPIAENIEPYMIKFKLYTMQRIEGERTIVIIEVVLGRFERNESKVRKGIYTRRCV